ncbi:MAG TPA: acetyl-CoA carboxylase biotin carboxyl carrier protein, partial [Alphaproteobacteria bacterium]
MKIDDKAIRKLAGLLDETGLTEIEVVEGDQMIRVSKGGVSQHGHSHHMTTAAAVHPMSNDPGAPQIPNTKVPAAVTADHPGAVASPMVGTAYLSPEPGASNFVKKGDSV